MNIPVGFVQATNIAAEGFGVESGRFGYVLHIQNYVRESWIWVGSHLFGWKWKVSVSDHRTKSMQQQATLPRRLLKR